MFDIGSSELLMIVIVAIVVIGPKDLPRALYKVGQVMNKVRGMSRHFRSGLDAMVREVELEEMEKKWAAENRRIMEQYPDRSSPMVAGADASVDTDGGGDSGTPNQAALPASQDESGQEEAGTGMEAVSPIGAAETSVETSAKETGKSA